MPIVLDHMIVPARDKDAAAAFFARIFGLGAPRASGHFTAVRVNDTLTLDFDSDTGFGIHHYAFKVGDGDFDAIFARLKTEDIPYGSMPFAAEDLRVNTDDGGRRVYFKDPSGHLLEIMTR